ncbi:Ran-specific GTPase-activating protein 30 [Xanthoria parietina]
MDLFLGKVTQQAMNYAIRSGITITASYAIKQSTRLLKTVDGSEKEELQDLQERLDSKIKIISPAIDMIELISARGNTTLESAVSLTKSLRREIQALGQRLAEAANTDERAHSGKLKAQEKAQHELELKRVVQSIKKLLNKIDDAVPMINLAITASGTNLSSGLPTTVSPSRLLQASTFLTAGDSQYSLDPSKPVQIGPTFILSMYMLFAGHIRPQYEEDIRESTWKEVIHKANVKLMRVPLFELYELPGQNQPASRTPNGSSVHSPELANTNNSDDGYFRIDNTEGARSDEYAYQLVIVEDLEDDRVHTFEDGDAQPGPFEDVNLAGIREALPVHELSKIFYADTGKILNIGTEGELNNPILLLKRDINAIPPRKMMARKDEEIIRDHGNDTIDSTSVANQAQLIRTNRSETPESATSTPRKNTQLVQAPNPWRIPLDLDPEWIAFEVYTESEDSDVESEPDASSRQSRTPSRGSNITMAMSRLDLQPTSVTTPSSPFPDSSRSNSSPQVPPIRTSLSLLETLLRLLSLQQFQQTPHLSIPDELLTFFLSESASTGAASGDVEERKRVRDDARRRVGFDPYDESPIKRRGEEYQYRDQRDRWNTAADEYGMAPYTPEQGMDFDGANSSQDFATYPSPMSASGRSGSGLRSPTSQQSPLLLKNHRSRSGTPSSGRGLSNTPSVRWRPNAIVREDPTKRSSPLARPGTGFTDEGLGSSPQSNNRNSVIEPGVKDGDSEDAKKADVR